MEVGFSYLARKCSRPMGKEFAGLTYGSTIQTANLTSVGWKTITGVLDAQEWLGILTDLMSIL
jgi:hypothetical protein